MVNWPLHRKALSVGGNLYTRMLLGMGVNDATAGYRPRAPALRAMGLEHVASQGYCFQVDLTNRAVRGGLRVVEVPITFVERDRRLEDEQGHHARVPAAHHPVGLQHRAGQLRSLAHREPTWHRL